MTMRRWLVRMGLGVALGALLTLALLDIASLLPRRYVAGQPEVSLPAPAQAAAVRVSFVETAEAYQRGYRLVQGTGLAKRRIAFRAVLIEHPAGNVLLGTGASTAPPLGVSNPFGRVNPLATLDEALAGVTISQVLLPTLRWFHLGGVDAVDAPLLAANAEVWAATEASMPRRYAIDPVGAAPVADATSSLRMVRSALLGRPNSADLFGDGTVLVGTLRGSSFDELVVVVTLGSGRRLVLVNDSVWLQEQVSELRPRTPWAVWFFDRNRLRFPANQRLLHAVDQLDNTDVIAVLDGSVPVPLYPAFWE